MAPDQFLTYTKPEKARYFKVGTYKWFRGLEKRGYRDDEPGDMCRDQVTQGLPSLA